MQEATSSQVENTQVEEPQVENTQVEEPQVEVAPKKKGVASKKKKVVSTNENASLLENPDGNIGRLGVDRASQEASSSLWPARAGDIDLQLSKDHKNVETYIKAQLEIHERTENMLNNYGFEVFQYCGEKRKSDETDAFIKILEKDGTKESAKAVAEFLSLERVKLDGIPLSVDNPLDLHLREGCPGPLRSYVNESLAHEKILEVPAIMANLDCDDVCHLLRMFDGCVAPGILGALFVPLSLHCGIAHESKWTMMTAVANGIGLSTTMQDNMAKALSLRPSVGSSRSTRKGSMMAVSRVGKYNVWKNPIYSAHLLAGEVRTYTGEDLKSLIAPDSWYGTNNVSCGCGIFAKPGLRSLVPQSYHDRIVAGGDLFQVFWPFHERRKVHVSYGILNMHEDVGCVEALVNNRNPEVFDTHECQAIIRHVLGNVSSMVYGNLLSNLIIVCLWLAYSREMRQEAMGEQKSWFFARCLLMAYIVRSIQIVFQLIGASRLGMLAKTIGSLLFWWQMFQTSASILCLITLWGYGTQLTNMSRAIVASIIGAQWWNALFALRILRTLGECIMPIVYAMARVNVTSFILISTFFTCGMAHALYTLGLHELSDAAMLTYRLAVLGDFDLAELDGSETGLQATEKTNSSLTSLDMAPYEFGSTEENQTFTRFFVLVVGVMSTVLLMNVLIGVLSKNFEEEYDQRTRSYWKSAGNIALQFAQQWEGIRQVALRVSCGVCHWEPVLAKVTAREKKLAARKKKVEPFKHLWFCTPHQSSQGDEDLPTQVENLKEQLKENLELLKQLTASGKK